MSRLTGEQRARVAAAVKMAWEQAGLDCDPQRPRIVPLDDLISAFPIGMSEVRGLTKSKASRLLSARSGQEFTLSDEADVPLSGLLYSCAYNGAVLGYMLVEEAEIVERRRFSAAHELGHYLLHFRPRIELELREGESIAIMEGLTYGETGQDEHLPMGSLAYTGGGEMTSVERAEELARMELEANQFAADLLMPREACQALLRRFGHWEDPARFASQFLVSTSAMRWRLTKLDSELGLKLLLDN